ncbi:hypothetical protein CHUAL_010424 [Chamberlinius hualienensis]
MALVEGVGDEVLYVIGGTLILLILLFAWYSTFVSDQPIFRASVFVIERRRTNHNSNVTESTRRVIVTSGSYQPPTVTNENVSPRSDGQIINQDQQLLQQNTTTPLETSDNNRDEFNSASTNLSANEVKEETDDQNQLRHRLRANVTNTETQEEQQSVSSDSVQSNSEGNIRIRLVFLNDTQRLVEAKLEDRLGQFKQNHFREELANHRVVRLIYNGQLLQGDQETLQYYGLSDNCVVHCHISSTASIPPPSPSFSSHSEDLDLGRLMLPLFGLILGLIWCCRMHYRQYFNTASTFALVGITGLFVISVLSVCLTARNRMVARRQ